MHILIVIHASAKACFVSPLEKIPIQPPAKQTWRFKCLFCKEFDRALEGKQRAEEHVLACTTGGRPVKGCAGIPIALRDELRGLRGLTPYTPPAQKAGSYGGTASSAEYLRKQDVAALDRKQCRAWYSTAMPFAAASNTHFRDFLAALPDAPKDYRPLDQIQLASMERITDVEKEVLATENALIEQSGGGFCCSTDGGKVGYAATRVVMADCAKGTFWLACYATGDATKDAQYLCDHLMAQLRLAEARGWKCRGVVTDNAASEAALGKRSVWLSLLRALTHFQSRIHRRMVYARECLVCPQDIVFQIPHILTRDSCVCAHNVAMIC